jgi:hypothetical protein
MQRSTLAKPLPPHPTRHASQRTVPSELERIVRKMTRGRDLGDIAVIDSEGRVIVVHTGDVRAQAYR